MSLADLLNAFDTVSELSLPFFVFIDELDRCRPPYAIALLERIKHVFDVDDIVFVFATDTVQLTRAIAGFYGSDFDGHNYLHRFFTRTFALPKPKSRDFIAAMIAQSGVNARLWDVLSNLDAVDFLAEASERFGAGLREIQRALEILFDLTTAWKFECHIELTVMYPYILGFLRAKNVDEWTVQLINRSMEQQAAQWRIGRRRTARRGQDENPPNLSQYFTHFDRVRTQDIFSLMNTLRISIEDAGYQDRIVFEHVLRVLELECEYRFPRGTAQEQWSLIASYPDLIRYAGNLE